VSIVHRRRERRYRRIVGISGILDHQGRILQNTIGEIDLATVERISETHDRITGARGLVAIIQYDIFRRPIQTTYLDGSNETTQYEPIYGRKVRHTNTSGITSAWAYDAKGKLTE
jgi:hypothetical protein